MMKRFLFAAALLGIGVGTASADFVIIKVDLNKINLAPTMPAGTGAGGGAPVIPGGAGGLQPAPGTFGGGFGGFNGGGGTMPPAPPGMPPPPPDDPNAKWISAVVEIKKDLKQSKGNMYGGLLAYEHKWSTRTGFMAFTPLFPWAKFRLIDAKPFNADFTAEFTKEDREYKANKDKEKFDKTRHVDNFLYLARKSLARSHLKEFRKVMDKIKEIDDKHPVVKNYARVEKFLKQPLKNDDPAQVDLLQELKQGYKAYVSKQGHYCLYAQSLGDDRQSDAGIARRLAVMEETLEIFYLWFAVQRDVAVQPNFPKFRLNAILAASKEEFTTRHLQWGSVPMVADGFTPRRDNVMVMSNRARLNDPLYHELDKLINEKIQEANLKMEQIRVTFTRDDLLTGKIYDNKATNNAQMMTATAQTLVVLAKALEDGAERHTVTNETVRQLLIASEMFPRNVQLPDWMIEGLSALLETPAGAAFPTIGEPSWTHAISFKHLRTKTQKLAAPRDVLYNVLRDYYFQDARQVSREMQDQPASPQIQRSHREAWELARCSAWAFTYYLAQKGKLDYLFQYGKELDRLPRDMDLNELVLEGSFAKAFNMADSRDAGKVDEIKMYNMAGSWFALMDTINLEPSALQDYYLKERARLDPSDPTPPTQDPNPAPPNPMPPPNKDPQQPINLANTNWGGSETLANHGPLAMNFHMDNKVTVVRKGANHTGTYNQNGNSVTINLKDGTVFNGSINGTNMQGNGNRAPNNWSFTVTRDAPPNQTINPNNPVARPPVNRNPPPPPPRVVIRRF